MISFKKKKKRTLESELRAHTAYSRVQLQTQRPYTHTYNAPPLSYGLKMHARAKINYVDALDGALTTTLPHRQRSERMEV